MKSGNHVALEFTAKGPTNSTGCINSYSVGSLTYSQRATSTLGNTGHKSLVSKCQVWRGTGRPAILYLLSRQCTGAYISRDM